jgi:HCOMODA/2-hydroxy-3-carboxy-muconic semialdehyde decarboxylase
MTGQHAGEASGRDSFLERFIHGEIYKARPDIMSVVHSHSPSVIPFGLVATPMLAMFHNAAFIAAGVPVFDIREKFGATDMLIGNGPKGVALAAVMGRKDIVLMRGHGSVACGPTACSLQSSARYTEVNARSSTGARHWGGAPIAALDAEEGRLGSVNQTAGMRAEPLAQSGMVGRLVNSEPLKT